VTPVDSLCDAESAALARDGFLMIRGGIPIEWREPLRQAFDANVRASDAWPVPRGHDWHHAQFDHAPLIQRVCRLPALLSACGAVIGGAFHLAQVEGRAPRINNAVQLLHRDAEGESAHHVSVFAYLDDFGPDNGATQIVPGSHLRRDGAPGAPVITHGRAGDVLVIDARLLHGATSNASGMARRTMLIGYVSATHYAEHEVSRSSRGVTMDTGEIFAPFPARDSG